MAVEEKGGMMKRKRGRGRYSLMRAGSPTLRTLLNLYPEIPEIHWVDYNGDSKTLYVRPGASPGGLKEVTDWGEKTFWIDSVIFIETQVGGKIMDETNSYLKKKGRPGIM